MHINTFFAYNKYAKSYWRALLLILFLSFHFVSCKKTEDPAPSTNTSIENLTLKLEDKEYPIVFDDKNNAVLTFSAGTKLPPTVTIQQITIAPKASTTVKQNDKLPIINSQIIFSVTAEDGIKNSKYTITFAVKAISGATLSSLKLNIDGNQYIPNFNSGTTATITLPGGSTIPKTVTITEIDSTEGTTSSVNTGGSLDVVNNKFSITITSQDGKKTNHYIIVLLVKPSTGAEIKTLTLKVNENTYTPDFNASTNVVITLVPGEDIPNEVTVTSLSLSEGAEASVKQNDKLAIKDDQVSIVITSEDEKTTNTYTLSFVIQKLVRFDTDGGSTIPSIAVPVGQMLTLPAEPTKAGFTFYGWFTDSSKTTAFDFNTPITENITLYAKWNIAVTVTTYTGTNNIGQGVLDESFAEDKSIITMENVTNGSWTIKFSADMSLTKTAAANTITITKGEMSGLLTNGLASFASLTNNEGVISFTVSNSETSTGEILLPYSPEKIYTWEDLQAMRLDFTSDYSLMNDITVPDTYNFAPIKGSDPANNAADRYSGKFNGQEHTVTLTINRPRENVVGLFGAIGAEGEVKSLGLAGNIVGNENIGAFAGLNYGWVSRVHTSAEIKGGERIGGLVGTNKSGATLYGYSSGKTKSAHDIAITHGGLAGLNESGATIAGYATGDLENESGISEFGGLVGWNQGMVIGYATGNVLINSEDNLTDFGGLVGNNEGTIVGYAKGNVGGDKKIGGLTGNSSDNAVCTGYARGNITKNRASHDDEEGVGGPVFGNGKGTQSGYYSGKTGESVVTGVDSNNLGTAIEVDASTTKANFRLFTFGTAVGEWTFVPGKWPAINLPPEVGGNYAPEDQPIDP